MNGQTVTLADLRRIVHQALGVGMTFEDFLEQVQPAGQVAVGYVTATWALCCGADGRPEVGRPTAEEYAAADAFTKRQREARKEPS